MSRLGRAALVCFFASACGSGTAPKTLGALGADCVSGGDSACLSGQCLVLDSATAFCTQACLEGADCPTSFVCAAGPAGTGKLCQQIGQGGICTTDNDCPAGLKCDTAGARCYIPVTRSACGPCTSDLQCGTGGQCHAESSGERFCASACGAGGACPTGYSCSGNVCLPANKTCRGGRPLCAPCAGDLECGGPGDYCVRNLVSEETFCAVHCASNSDCAKGFSCMDLSGKGSGPFQCVPDSGTCEGYCDATDAPSVQRECGLGATCDLANHACARLTDGSLCATCQTDDDCTKKSSTSRCVVNRTPGSPFLGEQFCGQDCSTSQCATSPSDPGCTGNAAACPGQYACTGIGTGGKWPYQCVPLRGSCESGFGRLGDDCAKGGALACVSAICAQFGTEQRCSAACTVDADCGDARWRCCAGSGASAYDCTHAPTTAGSGVCAPVGGSFGDDCAPGSPPCQEGLCLDLGTAQVCTRGCDAAHPCATGFSCQSGTLRQSDGTLGNAVNVCFPDGGGGIGASCTFGPAACQSHLCLKKDSGSVCTRECAADVDCPAGWACASESVAGGTSENVCVPPGTSP